MKRQKKKQPTTTTKQSQFFLKEKQQNSAIGKMKWKVERTAKVGELQKARF